MLLETIVVYLDTFGFKELTVWELGGKRNKKKLT